MPKRVLVVDDDDQTVQLVRTALVREGYDVEAATNGAECLLAIDRSRPDLVILDVTMPVLDGYRVLEAIRERPDPEPLPVIMLTARSTDRDVTDSVKRGADLHISKPFELAELLAATRALLAAADQEEPHDPDAR